MATSKPEALISDLLGQHATLLSEAALANGGGGGGLVASTGWYTELDNKNIEHCV